MKEEIAQAFERARQKVKELFPQFSFIADEVQLEILNSKDGWDIQRSIKDGKIIVNVYRLRWHLQREKVISCPKYDLETALLHDFFEYCYIKFHRYSEDDLAINSIVHHRARALENLLRTEKGLRPWV